VQVLYGLLHEHVPAQPEGPPCFDVWDTKTKNCDDFGLRRPRVDAVSAVLGGGFGGATIMRGNSET
jgi:hypothetical protein